jgi:Domain of unknown function (DUF4402)
MISALRLVLPLLSLAVASHVTAQSACQLCSAPAKAPNANKPKRPLHVDIDTSLDFSLAAHTQVGAGSIEIDPKTGERRMIGGLVALGGSSMRGTVNVEGEPLARVTVTVPTSIKLNSTRGDKAEVTDIQTSLPADPVIGADGRLTFSFGGRLTVQDAAVGQFHGRIHINVDYQ